MAMHLAPKAINVFYLLLLPFCYFALTRSRAVFCFILKCMFCIYGIQSCKITSGLPHTHTDTHAFTTYGKMDGKNVKLYRFKSVILRQQNDLIAFSLTRRLIPNKRNILSIVYDTINIFSLFSLLFGSINSARIDFFFPFLIISTTIIISACCC